MVRFIDKDHKYESDDNTEWISVTTLTKKFQEAFDLESIAVKSSKNKKSKWYGFTVQEIKQAWEDISFTAIELGNWYHKEQEKILCQVDTIEREGNNCIIIKPIINDNIKYAPEQKLKNNHIYPEHFVYLKSAKICGQSDLVEVKNNKLSIIDYKTNRELTTEGYRNWQGITKKLLPPLSHIEDCKLNLYNIQLSLYMYIILKHNPNLEVGDLIIHHIIFEEEDRDRLGNRQYLTQDNGDPIVKEIVQYKLPYLKSEVVQILNHINSLS